MRWLALLLLLPGCPWCELDSTLDVKQGSTTLHPGERVTLELDSEGYVAGPDRCRGHWYVNEFEGGNPEVGVISRCGVFYATSWPRPRPYTVIVTATQYALGGCADCCPEESIEITVTD